jgi:hypothetical protein
VHGHAVLCDIESDCGTGAGGHGSIARHGEQLGHLARGVVHARGIEHTRTAGDNGGRADAQHGYHDDLFDEGTADASLHGA